MSFLLKNWQQGKSADSWQYLGCHTEKEETIFRVWVPGAAAVAVTGPFCGWSIEGIPAAEIKPGLFECKIAQLPTYTPYKFVITASDGRQFFKSDPFAVHAETPPANASKIYQPAPYEWNDEKWMIKRRANGQPISIYQVHAGSFRTYAGGEPLNYRKLGEELAPYLKNLGCTHLGLMPLLEHMEETKAGACKTTGFFALTSRYGVPRDFCRMVELLHQTDIGVIMDVDFLGFPEDDFGLSCFTGEAYWEAETQDGYCYFDFEHPEVRSLLLSSADYLAEAFHLDGFRFLNAAKIAARPGGKVFLKGILQALRKLFPQLLLIGDEESLPFDRISDDTTIQALFRLAAGSKESLPAPKPDRIQQIDLPSVGTISMINQMPGSYDEKFARLRAAIACYRALPGAKLSLMGNEFAQFTPWDPCHQLDWILLDYEMHRKFLAMVRRTSDFYRKTSAIWEDSPLSERFEPIESQDYPYVKGFIRRDQAGNQIIVLANFSDQTVAPYVLGVEKRGKYAELFSSDEAQYGGEGRNCHVNFAKLRPADGKPYCIEAELPPCTTVYFYKSAGTTPNRHKD